MIVKFEYINGKETNKIWSKVYGYTPESKADKDQLGSMYAVFKFETELEDFAIDKFAKIIIESLQTSYFEELKEYKSTLERLEESCWKMKSKIDLLLSREEEAAKIGIDIEMAIAVFKNQYLYAVTIGESKIFIEREGNFVDISEGLTDRGGQGFLKSASLEVQETDKICLTTSSGNKKLLNIEEALEKLDKKKLVEKGSQEGVSIMFIADESQNWAPEVETKELDTDKGDLPNDEKKEDNMNFIEDEDTEFVEQISEEEDTKEGKLSEDELIETQQSENAEIFENPVVVDQEETESENSAIGNIKNKALGLFSSIKQKFPRRNSTNLESSGEEEDVIVEELDEDATYSERREIQDEFEYEDTKEKTGLIRAMDLLLGSVSAVIAAVKNHFKDNKKTYAHIVNTIISKIKKTAIFAYQFFETEVMGKNMDRRVMNRRRVKRNRYIFVVLVLFIVFGSYSIINSSKNGAKLNEAVEEYETLISEYDVEIGSIEQEILNETYAAGGEDKQALIERLILLEENVASTITKLDADDVVKNKAQFFEQLRGISSSVAEAKEDVLNIESFTEPQIVADLSRQFNDSDLTDLEYSEGYLFVSDAGRDVIYRVSPELESDVEVHETEVTEPQILVRNTNGEIIVYDKDEEAVMGHFDPTDKESLKRYENLIPPSVGKPFESAIFDSNGALYEINQIHQQIFKREPAGDTFANGGAAFQSQNPPNWKQDPELSRAIDIAAPYEIYVLTEDLGVRRYLAGGPNTLERQVYINLLDSDFTAMQKATALDVNISYMAVGDSINQRVLLFQVQDNEQKNLIFTKQFRYVGTDSTIFTDIREIKIVDGYVYVLDGNRIIRLAI
ncbi:hypothetical protein KC669_04780 [Candidatus Dojkabacteria bacterium]|uniref:Uncharacterized protein n=1 Tax=Candidatus Dojkabacteria bacterium TaxID=2099670 RepID=A0A955LBQ3_9BACT|nr:hypothetical protein [Candidatus Dojkabacteria bacterium]